MLALVLAGCADSTLFVGIEEAEQPSIESVTWPEDGRFEGTTPVRVTVSDRLTSRLAVEVAVGDTTLASTARSNSDGPVSIPLLIPSRRVNGPTTATIRVADQAGNEASVERRLRPRARAATVFGEEQLPNCLGDVNDIAGDPDGRTWMATEAGILAFDGSEVQRYAASEPLGTCFERGFAGIDAARDTIWALAATPREGLSIFGHGGTGFTEIRPFDPGRAIAIVDFFVIEGDFYVITDREVFRAQRGQSPQRVYATESALTDPINDADLAPDGTLWIAQEGRLVRRGPGGFETVNREITGTEVIDAVSRTEVWVARGDRIGKLTTSASDAFDLPDPVQETTCGREAAVDGLAATSSGNLWVATGPAGGLHITDDRYFLYPPAEIGTDDCSGADAVWAGPSGGVYFVQNGPRDVVYFGPGES